MNITELTLKNDSDLAAVYAKAGCVIPAFLLARSAASCVFKLHPELREPMHVQDDDCTLSTDTNLCIHCGVEHGAACLSCGGRGFHSLDCRESDATAEPDGLDSPALSMNWEA